MSGDGDSQHDGRASLGTGLVVSLLIIVAYPFSLGPMFWLCDQNIVADDNPFWTAVYLPLGWVVERWDWGAEMLMAYLDWWVA